MKNYVMAGAVVLSAFLFFGCGGQNKTENRERNECRYDKDRMYSGNITER